MYAPGGGGAIPGIIGCAYYVTRQNSQKKSPVASYRSPGQGSTEGTHTRIRARRPVPPRLLAARTVAGAASREEGDVPSAGTAAAAGAEAGTSTYTACPNTAR